jgi:hypothetical protein
MPAYCYAAAFRAETCELPATRYRAAVRDARADASERAGAVYCAGIGGGGLLAAAYRADDLGAAAEYAAETGAYRQCLGAFRAAAFAYLAAAAAYRRLAARLAADPAAHPADRAAAAGAARACLRAAAAYADEAGIPAAGAA